MPTGLAAPAGPTAPHSSRGPGHRPLKAEITGSNPVCGTNQPIRLRRGVICPPLHPYLIQAIGKVVHEWGNAAEAHDLHETLRNASPAA